MKLWQKNYKLNKKVEEFTVGNDFIIDMRLIKYDCTASIAHAKMLGKIGVLQKKEVDRLVKELNKIIKKGIKISKKDEDCHTAIENYLIKKLGSLGKKIHTARSRNDQVLTALRLYCKKELNDIKELSNDLVKEIEGFITRYGYVKLPGYTHTRKAMPSNIKLWSEAFIDSMKDNLKLIDVSVELIDQNPLGTGAGYGVPIKVDRKLTQKILGFKKIQKNPIYAQLSRGKFEATALNALSQIMLDFNKIATELIMFTMPEFEYFELPPEFLTGSSIMPQKKNPDVLELIRAKYHVVNSYEFQVKGVISNLITGYNRDLQLTKEPIIRGIQTTKETIEIMKLIFSKLKVNKEMCSKGLTNDTFAAEKVHALVKQGMTFRDAYRKVSEEF